MAVVVALVTSGMVFFGTGRGSVPSPPPAGARPDAAPGTRRITVHVSGAVADPGLVELAEGARIADALAAAGGSASGADLTAVNLAAPVRDGDQIVVPTSVSPGGAGSPDPASDGKVRLNQASATELETLPGVGPVLARRIVEYRDTHGPFAEVEDLLDVPGIGEAKLATLREYAVLP